MSRRIFAWVLLAGFVFLLLNIMVFHFYLVPSIVVYLLIAVWFIFNNKPLPSRKKISTSEINSEEDQDADGEQ